MEKAWYFAAVFSVLGAAFFSVVAVAQSYCQGKTVFSRAFSLAVLLWLISWGLIILKPYMAVPPSGESLTQKTNHLPEVKRESEPVPGLENDVTGKEEQELPPENTAVNENVYEPGAEPRWAKVICPAGLNLRAEPSEESDILGGLRVNQLVVIVDDSGSSEWTKVKMIERGIDGWVYRKYIIELPKKQKEPDQNIDESVETIAPGNKPGATG